MIKYTAKYRVPGQFFWRKIKGVIGDGIDKHFRYIVLQDDSILYLPISSEVFFSKERVVAITDKLSKEAGQRVQNV